MQRRQKCESERHDAVFAHDAVLEAVKAYLDGESSIAAVEELIAAGANVDASGVNDGRFASAHFGVTPLMLAAESGNSDLVAALLAAGADVHARDEQLGETALFFSLAPCSADVASLLLAAGADVEEENASGDTVLGRSITEYLYYSQFTEENYASFRRVLMENGATYTPESFSSTCRRKGDSEPQYPDFYFSRTGDARRDEQAKNAGDTCCCM